MDSELRSKQLVPRMEARIFLGGGRRGGLGLRSARVSCSLRLACRISRQHIMHTSTYRRYIAWVATLLVGVLALAPQAAEPESVTVHVGLMAGTMHGPSVTDIKVAMKLWLESIVEEQQNYVTQMDVQMHADQAAIEAALLAKTADLLVMGTDDFYALGGHAAFDRVFLYVRDGSVKERYLLLARADSGIKSLPEMRDRKLILLDNACSDLAERWLDSLLRHRGLPAVRQLTKEVVTERKPSRCIQRVFFHNTDLCLVTEKSYRIAVELNPQLGEQLITLAVSPGYVSSIIAIPTHCTAGVWPALERGLLSAHTNPKGKELLRVYRIDRMVRQTGDELASAKALLTDVGEVRKDLSAKMAAPQPATTSGSKPCKTP